MTAGDTFSTSTSSARASTSPRIAIVGAGPGGLMASRVLEQTGIRADVYDADASATRRDPGGTLDLHADSGQLAIASAGLTAEFAALARPEGQTKKLVDPASGQLIKTFVPEPGEYAAPEIDRGQLRMLLRDAVDTRSVHWGRRLTSLERVRGAWRLTFADGSAEIADVVIGADGAWSRVRPMITHARPRYSGVSFIELVFTDVDTRHPGVAALVGDGHLWANGDGKNLILQRSSSGVVRGYLGARIELDWLSRAGLGEPDGHGGVALDANGLQQIDTAAVREVLRAEFAAFAPELRELIVGSEGELTNRPVFALPAPLAWEHVTGLTLVGDAAHLMSPFGGNGVNAALMDAAELARVLAQAIDAGTDVDDALAGYERAMFARTGPAAVNARDAIERKYQPGGMAIDDIPDFGEQGRQWNANAAAYRARAHVLLDARE